MKKISTFLKQNYLLPLSVFILVGMTSLKPENTEPNRNKSPRVVKSILPIVYHYKGNTYSESQWQEHFAHQEGISGVLVHNHFIASDNPYKTERVVQHLRRFHHIGLYD